MLTVTKRPLAAVKLADAKSDQFPGYPVVGAAARCGAGIGDAATLSDEDQKA